MNKADLIDSIANDSGLTKVDSKRFLDAIIKNITEALIKNDKVALVGFGLFSVTARPERIARNPQTGKEIIIPGKNIPVFKAGSDLNSFINSARKATKQVKTAGSPIDSVANKGMSEEKGKKQKDFKQFYKTTINLRDKNSIDGVLGVYELAEELGILINNMPTEENRMLAIFGKWGRGKTFFLGKLWEYLNKDINYIRVDFEPWKYQDTPATWAYLYEQFSQKYYEGRNWFTRTWNVFRLNTVKFGWTQLILFGLSLAAYIIFMIYGSWESLTIDIVKITGTLGIGAFSIKFWKTYIKFKHTAKDIFSKYFSKSSFTDLLGIQAEIQIEFRNLIKAWKQKNNQFKILLFVDDLDRCSEEKIISIIDSLRVMLEDQVISENLVIITAVDERILKRAINFKYSRLINKASEDTITVEKLTKEYIDKLFILALKLNDLNAKERDEFLYELTKSEREAMKIKTSEIEYNSLEDIIDIKEEEKEETDEMDTELYGDIEDISIDTSHEAYSLMDEEEFKILRHSIQISEGTTPRQIRIFYYRYLLAKTLLISRYNKMDSKCIWLLPKFSRILFALLVTYSKFHPLSELDKEKAIVDNTKYMTRMVKPLKNKRISVVDYRALLDVLQIVIAY